MAANTDPIYTRTPDVQLGGAVLGPSANTATDGTGANITSIFQADATEGGFVNKVICKPVGTAAATVIRLFLCSVTGAFTAGTSNTAANTSLIGELSTVAWTASNTAASPQYEIPVNMPIPPGYRLLMAFGTSTGAAGNGFAVTTVGGKY
jgi:hypothetical protein